MIYRDDEKAYFSLFVHIEEVLWEAYLLENNKKLLTTNLGQWIIKNVSDIWVLDEYHGIKSASLVLYNARTDIAMIPFYRWIADARIDISRKSYHRLTVTIDFIENMVIDQDYDDVYLFDDIFSKYGSKQLDYIFLYCLITRYSKSFKKNPDCIKLADSINRWSMTSPIYNAIVHL